MGDCVINSLAVAGYPLPVEERLKHAQLALGPVRRGSLLLDGVREVLVIGLEQRSARVHAIVLSKGHTRERFHLIVVVRQDLALLDWA